MLIREYNPTDCKEIINLFYDTVHFVNKVHYSDEQLNVWAPKTSDIVYWNKTLQAHYTLVAIENGKIVGFGDIDKDGYLDRLFVQKDFIRKGIATAICNMLEHNIKGNITVHSSITAKDFFIKRGYKTLCQKKQIRNGITLPFYVMVKAPE